MNLHNLELESVYAKGEDGEFHLVARRDECETKATADKEYIEKETVIDTLCGHFIPDRHKYIEEIRALPAADVRPVVLCADCKYFTCGANDAESWAYCKFWHYDVDPTGFCSYGERMEES